MQENFTNDGWKETKQLGNNRVTIHNRYSPEPKNIVVAYTLRSAAALVLYHWSDKVVLYLQRNLFSCEKPQCLFVIFVAGPDQSFCLLNIADYE